MIKEIKAEATWPIRHKAMWPDKPLPFVQLPDDATGSHYGLFKDGKLISVISLFEKDGEMQFRKFATLQEAQGQGYGSLLLQHILGMAESNDTRRVWCNPRLGKSSFYEKFGLHKTAATFQKEGKAYVIMEGIF